MNESRHPIDDLFREGLENQQFEAPAHVWERIDQKRTPLYKLANNFRQNYRFYLSMVAGLAVLSSFALWLISDNQSSTQLAQADNGMAVISEDVSTTNPKTSAEASTIQMPEISSSFESNVQVNDHEASSQNPAIDQTPAETVNPAIQTPSPQEIVGSTPTKQENSSPITAETETPTAPEATLPMLPEADPNTDNSGSEPTKDPVKAQSSSSEQTSSSISIIPEDANQPAEASTNMESDAGAEDDGTSQENTLAPPKIASPWSIEVMGSYDFATRQILNAGDFYRNTRDNAEQVGLAYTFQARVGYRLKNTPITFKSGLSFSRINETMKFQDPYTVQEINERQQTGWIVDPINGPKQITYTVRDTQDVTKYNEVISNNRYSFLDIPLMVQYDFAKFGRDKRFSLGATAGALLNVRFDQRGQTLHSNSIDILDLETGENPFKTRANVDFMVNLSGAYSINSNFDILLEPTVRFGTGSLMKSSFGIGQRYNTYSIYTGIRYKF